MKDDADFVLASLKQASLGHYLSVLYLPKGVREAVAALWAFDQEINRIPELVSEPLPGEIRLQWWRDLIRSGDNSGSGPLARSLIRAIETHDLPRETLDTYLEARIFDLYQDPMPDSGTFEGYLGETASSLFMMAALSVGAERSTALADACGHAGMATGIARLLGSASLHRARQQVFLPLDGLESKGLDRESWLFDEPDKRHADVMEHYIKNAMFHRQKARDAIAKLDKPVRQIFLPVSWVRASLSRVEKNKAQALRASNPLSPLCLHWVVFCAAIRKSPC